MRDTLEDHRLAALRLDPTWKNRLRALQASYFSMGRFGRSPGNFGVKRSMEKGLLVNAALSGLEECVNGHLPLT
eukprot:4915039-Pyramimonas_sp.AAC.1